MDPVNVAKAGPSEFTTPERSARQRRSRVIQLIGKLVLGLFFLALIYKGLVRVFDDQNGRFWSWDAKQNSGVGQDEQSGGSQYLLGVGKADITG